MEFLQLPLSISVLVFILVLPRSSCSSLVLESIREIGPQNEVLTLISCHTCGGKGHFKRECPNKKVMLVNEDNEYETGDDADPNEDDDACEDEDGPIDAYATH